MMASAAIDARTSRSAAPAGAGGAPTAQAILDGLKGEIRPIRTTATYRLGILAVSVVMILLPLIYIALIVAVGYGVYWHTINNVGMLEHGRGRGKIVVLLAYLAPLIVGSIMTLFMMKPLFARAAKRPRKRLLTREEEPQLFAFVDRVCQAVHAPRPKRIDIDCDINASAGFRRGIWSMLLGNDLVLTIGMPLVLGFSLRQFAGVLAHEFGHFAQGAGMRLTFIIRTISFWFTRVVYERDSWDVWLDQTAKQIDLRVGWVLHLARLFVWLSRRFLWVLMIVGHTVAGYLLRQMEYDADRHEARLAGSDVFASTVRRLIELNVANSGAQQDLKQFYRDGRLGDDLPRLIQVNVEQFPADLQTKITELISESKTGKFDTHPCDKDRIESARRENAPGIFHVEGPASLLFRNADASCQAVTTDFYEQVFGEDFRRDAVHPLDDLLARQNRDIDSMRTMERYFQGTFNLLRPLPIPTLAMNVHSDPATTIAQLLTNRELMLSALPAFQSAYKQLDEADTHLLQAHCADSVFAAKEHPHANQFAFAVGTKAAVAVASTSAVTRLQTAEPDLSQFEVAAKHRFTAALELLFDPGVAQRIENVAEHQSECNRLLPVLQTLNNLIPATLAVRNTRTAIGLLFNYVKQDDNSAALIEQIKKEGKSLQFQLFTIKKQLQPLTYPFDHAQGPLSVGDFVIKVVPHEDALGQLYDAADEALEQIASLASRLLGRLSQTAEQVEMAIGLSALDPPKKE